MEPHSVAMASGCISVVYAAVLATARYFTFEETSLIELFRQVSPYMLLPASTAAIAHNADKFGDSYQVFPLMILV